MARPLRLEIPGALWHAMNRGVERRTIYKDSADYLKFLELMQEVIAKYSWRLYAFVLMKNHYHLLFETPTATLSRGMHDLDGDYGQAFNWRHSRVGHLFQGRFTAHVVDSESYLLELCRYIVLNPVRAGFVKTPGQWEWSSYQATAGLAPVPAWLDVKSVLDQFNPYDSDQAKAEYRRHVAAGMGMPSPWEHLIAQTFLGDEAFLKRVEEKIRTGEWSHEHPREQREFRLVKLDDVRGALTTACALQTWPPSSSSPARSLFAMLSSAHTNATNAAIGRELKVSGQAVGQMIARSRERMTSDPLYRNLASTVRGAIFRLST